MSAPRTYEITTARVHTSREDNPMTAHDAFRLAYRFIRSDCAIPWQEAMRPFKWAAIAANKQRLANGRDRWDVNDAYLRGRSENRRNDLIYSGDWG